MNTGVSIQIPQTPVNERTMAFLRQGPDVALRAIARAQTLATEEVVAKIIPSRLTGKGPFPPSEHRLGRVSHYLARTTVAAPAMINVNTVRTAIGNDAPYWFAHEFGSLGDVEVSSHRRNRPGLGKRRKRVTDATDVLVRGHLRHQNLPARAPVQTGILEKLSVFQSHISAALQLEWRAT
jgi:hypothetical protein